ncbi:hypothetical protein B296_00003769 [Ensete ventricosum]|uniref:Uncharacterized protein n=1 Tax=Ensete ventricosum TaxID=4639 RepID=A0A427BBJ9_ENSVE|nr:hypothetical protein B296_00003769 [Ensete ventricosum]
MGEIILCSPLVVWYREEAAVPSIDCNHEQCEHKQSMSVRAREFTRKTLHLNTLGEAPKGEALGEAVLVQCSPLLSSSNPPLKAQS